MKKTTLILNLFILLATVTFAQTNVSGAISSDATWSLINSPYIVTNNVVVEDGTTLIIEAGVTINVNSGLYIQNEGIITAIGTESNKITFQSNETTPAKEDWIGINIRPTGGSIIDENQDYSSGSQFKYVKIKHAEIGLYVYNTGLHISNCEFSDNKYGLEIRATDGVVIDNSNFSANNVGIWSEYQASGDDTIDNISNTFIKNSAFSNNAAGMDLNLNQREFSNLNITKNNINDNNTGISFGGGEYGPKVHSVLINENIIHNNSNYGVNLESVFETGTADPNNYVLEFTKNILLNNNLNIGRSYSYITDSPDPKFKIHKNIFKNNIETISCISFDGWAADSKGDHLFTQNTLISTGKNISIGTVHPYFASNLTFNYNLLENSGNNNIIDIIDGSGNTFNNNNFIKPSSNSSYYIKNEEVDTYNQEENSVNAENNYWGTTIETEIQTVIYDKSEDSGLGEVYYQPFLTNFDSTAPISRPTNVTKTDYGSDVVLNWSANEESDITGYKLHYGNPTGYSYENTIDLGNVTRYIITGGDISTEYVITAYDSNADGIEDNFEGNESWFSIAEEFTSSLSASVASISESDNSMTITATIDVLSSADIIFDLNYSGTSTNGTDFNGNSSITISSGSLTGNTSLTIIDDNDVELTETITIDMSSTSAGYENITGQIIIDLIDDDLPSISGFDLNNTAISEKEGEAILTATISDAISNNVTIPLTITGTANINSDYTTSSENIEITIPAGATTGTFTFTGIEDSVYNETDETIIITPLSPSNAELGVLASKTVTITNYNYAPSALNQSDIIAYEQIELNISLSASDLEEDNLTYIIASLPSNGTLTDPNNNDVIISNENSILLGSTITYNSSSDTATDDSFSFKVNDGELDSNIATIGISITPINDAPTLSDISASTNEDTNLNLTFNAIDPDSNNITYSIVSESSNGTVTISGDTATYIPLENFNGNDSFTVIANDGELNSDTATISIIVNSVNDIPISNENYITIDEGATTITLQNGENTVLFNDIDNDNDSLTAILVSNPENGSLTLNADGTFSYEHYGSETTSDSFTYKANDGLVDSEITTVNITINLINDNLPTDIILSNDSVEENLSSQVIIGQLIVSDLDLPSDNHMFEFTNGNGDDDNTSFTINGNNLLTNISFDYETQQTLSIRLKVIDANNQYFEKILIISIINVNDINLISETTNSYCSAVSGTGSINITSVNQTIGTVTYNWSANNGGLIPTGQENNQNLTDLTNGNYYLSVTDVNFTYNESFQISLIPQYNDLSICYVSSDNSEVTKNRIYLNNQGNYNVAFYEILRESNVENVYTTIGTIESTENSFLDNTSNNISQSYNYKVRLIDNCDIMSSNSDLHKTILLQSSIAVDNTVNLNWSDYLGKSFTTYTIFRNTNQEGFQMIGSVSAGNNSYNDTTANVADNNYEYYISIEVDACLNQSAKRKSNSTTEVKSNYQNIEMSLSVNDFINSKQVAVYPNPSSIKLNIKLSSGVTLVKGEVYNTLGQIIMETRETNFSIENLPSSTYFIKIVTSKGTTTKRFIKK
jgi:VCBS repeat-containing protein